MSIGRHAAWRTLGNEGRCRVLVVAPDDPLELHPPGEHAVGTEAELAEGNAILGRPPRAVPRRGHAPDGVPRVVVVLDRLHFVALHAGRVDVEAERGAMVVIAVEHHAEPVGVAKVHVAAAEPRGYGTRVVQPRAHIERLVVVEHANLGALRRRLALEWVDLPED